MSISTMFVTMNLRADRASQTLVFPKATISPKADINAKQKEA
jgi:hypothetical protein